MKRQGNVNCEGATPPGKKLGDQLGSQQASRPQAACSLAAPSGLTDQRGCDDMKASLSAQGEVLPPPCREEEEEEDRKAASPRDACGICTLGADGARPIAEAHVEAAPQTYESNSRQPVVAHTAELELDVDLPSLWWRTAETRTPRVLLVTARWKSVLVGVRLTIGGKELLALIDSGATHSFVVPRLVDELQLNVQAADEPIHLLVGNAQSMTVQEELSKLVFRIGSFYTAAKFLVAPVPFPIILGADWLQRSGAICDFGNGKLVVSKKGSRFELPLVPISPEDLKSKLNNPLIDDARRQARGAHDQLVKSVTQMGPGAAALVRKQPKRYKNFKTKVKRVPIKELMELAKQNSEDPQADPASCFMLLAQSKEPDPMPSPSDSADIPLADTTPLCTDSSLCSSTHTKVDAWLEEATTLGTNKAVICLIRHHRRLFVDELPDGLPPPRILDMTILLVPGATVPKGGTPRFTPPEMTVVRATLEQYLRKKWIQRTDSPFAAAAMLVPKKGDPPGSPGSRMVINYRPLNSVTIASDVPLPVIEDVLASLHGAKWFTTMDMEQGFHQIRMAPEDRHKTAFRTILGNFEWCVMPFGLKGAPSTFQAIMNSMFFELLGNGVLVYMDDVLIYTKTFEEHLKLLDLVLQRLWDHKMFPKFSKCRFAVQSIEYLGYHIGADGVRPSPDKVKAISLWPTVLENDTQVRQFLGTVNYCRNFMGPEFAVLARPLQQLLKHGQVFHWTEEHSASVQSLKERLMNYTTLQLPDFTKPFVVRTDASGKAIGAVLEQDGKPLGFLSQRLTETEMKRSVFDLELLAVVRALEKWRYLLATANVTVYTDHQALQFLNQLKTDKPIRKRLARWLDFLADFQQLHIVYQPGATNVVADALSRCPVFDETSLSTSVSASTPAAVDGSANLLASQNSIIKPFDDGLSTVPRTATLFVMRAHAAPRPIMLTYADAGSELPTAADQAADAVADLSSASEATPALQMQGIGDDSWEAALQQCSEFGVAYQRAKEVEPNPVLVEGQGRFKFANRILCIQLQGLWRICVPNFPRFRQRILYTHHDLPTAGHLGITKTYNQVALRFYWKGIRAYTATYVETCPRCRASKTVSQKPAGLLQSLSIPSRRWTTISLDFILGFPKSHEGYDAILTVVDSLSKMAHFIPTTTSLTAAGFVQLFADRIVRYHGLPQIIISDRDPRFVSEFWRLFCQRFGIKRALSSAWHPQTDGQTERANRTIEQMLRTYIQSREEDWPALLPALELAYNCASHSATGLSPFEVMIGENPIRTQDLDLVDRLPPTVTPLMTKTFQALVERASAHLEHAKYLQKTYANASRRPLEFNVGDKVWISTKYMAPRGSPIFAQKYVGPFEISERIGKAAYKLILPPSMRVHPVFHVSLLTRDRPRPTAMIADTEWQPVAEANNEPPAYEVEHILDEQGEGPHLRYLVKWKGFPASEATWEPAANLDHCPALLRAFRASRNRELRRSARLASKAAARMAAQQLASTQSTC